MLHNISNASKIFLNIYTLITYVIIVILTWPTDCDDYKECCESSYIYGLYLECVKWYQKLESASGSKELMKFKVYNAKHFFTSIKGSK